MKLEQWLTIAGFAVTVCGGAFWLGSLSNEVVHLNQTINMMYADQETLGSSLQDLRVAVAKVQH